MADHSNDYLFSEIPNTAGPRYADDNGRPVYGGQYMDVGPDGRYVYGTSAAQKDEAFYRQLAMESEQAPQLDRWQETDARNKADEARALGLQGRGEMMGSLGQLRSGAYGTSRDMRLLRAGAEGTTDDAIRARQAAAGETEDMRLLEGAASGRAPSRAEMLGQQMSDRALRAQVSAAGNVRGGPGASAAAFRYASQNAAAQRADMNLGIQAERAQELANARGQYSNAMGGARRDYGNLMSGNRRDFGQYSGAARTAYENGTSDLRAADDRMRNLDLQTRDQDIRLASDQAHLEAGQRAEDAAKQRYFLGLENSTKFGDLASQTGSEDAFYAHQAAQRAEDRAGRAEDMARVKDYAGLASSVGGGVMNVAQMQAMYGGGGGGGGYAPPSSSGGGGGYAPRPSGGGGGGIVRDNPYGGYSGYSGGGGGNYGGVYPGDPYSDSGGGYTPASSSGGIYRDDPYSDMNAKQPIVWGSLAAPAAGGKPSPDGEGGSGIRVMYSDENAKRAAFVQGVKSGSGQEPPPAKYARSPEVQKHLDEADRHSDEVVRSFGQVPYLQVSGHLGPALYNAGTAGYHMAAGSSALGDAVETGQMEAARKAAGRAPRAVASNRKGISYGGADEKPSTEEFQAANPRLAEEPRFTGEPNPFAPSREETWRYLTSLPPVDPAASRYNSDQPSYRESLSDENAKTPVKAKGSQGEDYGFRTAQASMDQALAEKEDEKKAAKRDEDYTFQRHDTGAEQRRIKRAKEDAAGREADAMMAGMRASLGQGPTVAVVRDEGEVDDPKFGTMSDNAMAGAARSMQASPYAYKAEYVGKSGQAPGEVNVGPMAQSMARDPVASTAVTRDPETGLLAIDRDKGLKVVMGSLAAQQHQIDQLRRRTRRGDSAQP